MSSFDFLQTLVTYFFSKRFSLPTFIDGPCPKVEVTDVENPADFQKELLRLDAELNKTKSLLNDLALKPWHAHTRKSNPAGTVIQEIRNRTSNGHHNNCTPELLTQAWCKFTEILNAFPLVDRAKKGNNLFLSSNFGHMLRIIAVLCLICLKSYNFERIMR